MTCSLCPITVRKSLMSVNGVIKARVNFEEKEAFVIYDSNRITVKELIRATTNAGYPSQVIAGSDKERIE
ncbi:MAG: mercury transporter [Calditrichaeota bacterium]|nr:mercury transporter [Calditrichota bacterium]